MKTRHAPQLTISELASRIGVDQHTIREWRRDGLPAVKPAGKRKHMLYDAAAVRAWLASTDRGRYAVKLVDGPAPAVDTAPQVTRDDISDALSMRAMLYRLRGMELELFDMVQKARLHEPAMMSVWMEHHQRYGELRRKAEKDFAEIEQSQGSSVPKAEAERVWAEAAQIIRSDLSALPQRLCHRLAGREMQPAEVRTIILEAVREMVKGWTDAGQIKEEKTE